MYLDSLDDTRLPRELAVPTQQTLLARKHGKIGFASAAACHVLSVSAAAVSTPPFRPKP